MIYEIIYIIPFQYPLPNPEMLPLKLLKYDKLLPFSPIKTPPVAVPAVRFCGIFKSKLDCVLFTNILTQK